MAARRKREGYYTIGVVAKMYDIHPQTLRLYEKRGLLKPTRTEGNTRLYSQRDIEDLEFILTLTNELHVNVAGVEIIVQLRDRIRELQENLAELGQRIHAAEEAASMGPDCTKLVRVGRSAFRRAPLEPEIEVIPPKKTASKARSRKKKSR